MFIVCASSLLVLFFFFSSRRRHTRYWRDWSSDVCSSDLDHRAAQRDMRVVPAEQRGDRGLRQRGRADDRTPAHPGLGLEDLRGRLGSHAGGGGQPGAAEASRQRAALLLRLLPGGRGEQAPLSAIACSNSPFAVGDVKFMQTL